MGGVTEANDDEKDDKGAGDGDDGGHEGVDDAAKRRRGTEDPEDSQGANHLSHAATEKAERKRRNGIERGRESKGQKKKREYNLRIPICLYRFLTSLSSIRNHYKRE